MTPDKTSVGCPRCEKVIEFDFDKLDSYEYIVRMKEADQVAVKRYRKQCPRCGLQVVIEVEEE